MGVGQVGRTWESAGLSRSNQTETCGARHVAAATMQPDCTPPPLRTFPACSGSRCNKGAQQLCRLLVHSLQRLVVQLPSIAVAGPLLPQLRPPLSQRLELRL